MINALCAYTCECDCVSLGLRLRASTRSSMFCYSNNGDDDDDGCKESKYVLNIKVSLREHLVGWQRLHFDDEGCKQGDQWCHHQRVSR